MNTTNESKNRGTIIKVPDSTPGILFINGEQKPFQLEGAWKSGVAPAVNMAVDVEYDANSAVASVSAVDAQLLAKERMNQMSGAAQEQGKQAAALARQGIGALAARMGKFALVATVVLWIGWFLLPAAKVDLGFLGAQSFTFWEFLGLDLSNLMSLGTVNHGLFAMIGLAAIAAPFVAPFLRHPRANFLNAAPLLFLVVTAAKLRMDFGQYMGQGSAGAQGAGDMGELSAQMSQAAAKAAQDAVSIGAGTYLIVFAALSLALLSFKSRAKA